MLEIHDDMLARVKPYKTCKEKITMGKLSDVEVIFIESFGSSNRLKFNIPGSYDVSRLDSLSKSWLENSEDLADEAHSAKSSN